MNYRLHNAATIIETITARRWLVIFASIHLVVWTLLQTLLLHNAPIDVIEGVTWGRQWAWGYDKHPWLAPWLTAAAYTLGYSQSLHHSPWFPLDDG